MDDLAKLVRAFIFDRFLETASPPVVEEIMRRFKLTRRDASEVLRGLEAARHIALVKNTDRVLMAHPFSSLATPFRVARQNNRVYYANCSWDSIAFHVMLCEPIVIDSYCHHCGEDIHITLVNQRILSLKPDGTIVYLATPAAKWWEDITNTCSNNMTFFSSRSHLDEWLDAKGEKRGEVLSIDQTLRLSVPIYKGKLEVDYARPSREQLVAHFESLDLRGDFWKL